MRFCDELDKIKDLILRNKKSIVQVEIYAPISAEDIGEDQRFNSPLFYGVHAMEMGLEISKLIFEEKRDISNKCLNKSREIIFKNQNKSINITLLPSKLEFYKVKLSINKKLILDKDIVLDGSYYLNCSKLLKFCEEGLDEAGLPDLNEACEGISLLLG